MCGIVGYVGTPDPEVLTAMRDVLTHRGPDECGNFIDGTVSLGHRRLSIIDLEHGRQPATNRDGSVVLVYNGEIYNHLTVRRQLETRGYQYETQCDTESVIHAYEEYGTACVDHLDGMFAFVLFDRPRGLLFGARDRLGKKPLYHTSKAFQANSHRVDFAFASELKSLRQHPALGPQLQLSDTAVLSFLLHDYVAGPQSIYQHVCRLPAGHAFTFGLPGSGHEGFRAWRYWGVDFDSEASHGTPSEQEASANVRALLTSAVEARLMSDVPLGVLLSGGLDSSLVTALMTRLRPPHRVKTFTIGFHETSFDESHHAAEAAAFLGTDHHCRRFAMSDVQDQMGALIDALDEPFADPSILPYSMLCQFAREHVTVAMGGDGGDELFAGYDPFQAIRPARAYAKAIPGWLHRGAIVPLTGLIPTSGRNLPLSFKAARFLRGVTVPPRVRPPVWMAPFTIAQLERLVPDLARDLTVEVGYAAFLEESQELDHDVDIMLSFYQRCYLPDDILVKADRASMLHSLEVRSPLLDTGLVTYVNSLPPRMKLRRRTKYLLKRVAEGGNGQDPLLPRSIIHRRKKGFGIPIARWIREGLYDLFHETLLNSWPSSLGMFERREVARLLERHRRGTEDHYKELWALFMLASWTTRHASRSPTVPG
jgi:asparagine synthase (glutamine-hydrolysing)